MLWRPAGWWRAGCDTVTRKVVACRVRFSVRGGSHRGTERIQNALFRDVAGPGCAFPSRRGHRVRLSVECAFPYLGKRGAVSRKSAFCAGTLTEKHTLGGWGHGKAHSRWRPHGKAQSGWEQSYRVRLSVTPNPRMRLSVECAFPYLRKRGAVSRKSAFWVGGLTEKRIVTQRLTGKRILRFSDRANCAFPSHCRPRGMRCNHPPGCGALSKVTQLGKCVRATTRQAAGRFAPGSANLVWSLTSRKVAVWVRSLGAQLGRAAWMSSLGAQPG